MKKSATFAVLFVVLFLMENAVYAQTAVRGATQVPVGPGVSGIVFHGINKTNIEISHCISLHPVVQK